MNPYTYQRPKITPLPNETGLTVPGGTGVAVVPNGTPPALKQPYLPGQYTEYPAAVQGWAQQALPGWGSGIESGTSSTTAGFDDWLGKGATDNKVYFGMKDGTAQYTGITKQTKNARLNQHNNAGKAFDDLDIQYEGLTRNQARAIEQYYIENGPNALNKINSISPNNKYYQDAMNWAKQYLGVE